MSHIPQKRSLKEKTDVPSRRLKQLDETHRYTSTATTSETSNALVLRNTSLLTEMFEQIARDVFPEAADKAFAYEDNDDEEKSFDTIQALTELEETNYKEMSIIRSTTTAQTGESTVVTSASTAVTETMGDSNSPIAIIPVNEVLDDDLEEETALKYEPNEQELESSKPLDIEMDAIDNDGSLNIDVNDGSDGSAETGLLNNNNDNELIDQLTEESPLHLPACYSQRFPGRALSPPLTSSLKLENNDESQQTSQSLSFEIPSLSSQSFSETEDVPVPEKETMDEGGNSVEVLKGDNSSSIEQADADTDGFSESERIAKDGIGVENESEDEEDDSLIAPPTQSQRHLISWNDTKEAMVTPGKLFPSTFVTSQFRKLRNPEKVWWFHAYEAFKEGTIYLFGKILNIDSTPLTCTITVPNIERVIYIEPRTYELVDAADESDVLFRRVTVDMVKEEMSQILAAYKITNYKMDVVSKKLIIPNAKEKVYVRLRYSYKDVPLHNRLHGKTFSSVHGADTAPLENFIINRRIMGPCWLNLQNASKSQTPISTSQIDLVVTGPDDIIPLDKAEEEISTPPMTTMSISLNTVLNHEAKEIQIIAASLMICRDIDIDDGSTVDSSKHSVITIISAPDARLPPPNGLSEHIQKENNQYNHKVRHENTERALIQTLITYIRRVDPDILIGHNVTTVFKVLLDRMRALKIQKEDVLGRLRREGYVPSFYENQSVFEKANGRIFCDTYNGAKEYSKCESLNLADLAATQLDLQRPEVTRPKYPNYYSNAETIMDVANATAFEAYASCRLAMKLQFLSISKQLTNISGNLWSDSLKGGRAQRIEYLLLHKFHDEGYICPSKSNKKGPDEAFIANQDKEGPPTTATNAKAGTYTGGLVLEPEIGYYDKYVLLLDFNSLYPSIIQEYNVCFTTMLPCEDAEIPDTPDDTVERGILPDLLKQLVEERKLVKRKMASDRVPRTTYAQYNSRQTALKLTANSIYGCLGSQFSRFQAKYLAKFITSKGREILQHTANLAHERQFHVIYGDTDSVMLHTNKKSIKKARQIAQRFMEEVNKQYSLLELDIDAFYRRTLLLRKKKYAALSVKTRFDGTLMESLEIKGLDMVRRDWCERSKQVSREILQLILESTAHNEQLIENVRSHLQRTANTIQECDPKLFIIRKHLSRNPEEYSNISINPHAIVALHMRKLGLVVKIGDEIPYVMCKAGLDASVSPEPREPRDVIDGKYELDYQWYIAKQILPPVMRLLAPITKISLKELLEWLDVKLESLSVNTKANKAAKEKDEEKDVFEAMEVAIVECSNCHQEQIFARSKCEKCGTALDLCKVEDEVNIFIRKCINRYYSSPLRCNHPMCKSETNNKLYSEGDRCYRMLCRGTFKRTYSASALYRQLTYLHGLCDSQENDMARIRERINSFINLSNFKFVHFERLLPCIRYDEDRQIDV